MLTKNCLDVNQNSLSLSVYLVNALERVVHTKDRVKEPYIWISSRQRECVNEARKLW